MEDTLREQQTKFTPTAYFAVLCSLLLRTITDSGTANKHELQPSLLYLLDLISSEVPAALLRAKFNRIVSTFILLKQDARDNAPVLRSCIGCMESFLLAQDTTGWSQLYIQDSPRQTVQLILEFTLDERPKVRRRAQEALTNILNHPPPAPVLDHPVAGQCGAWALQHLRNTIEGMDQTRKQQKRESHNTQATLIHSLQLTKTIAKTSRGWPSESIEVLCKMLLSVSRSRNEFLVLNAFEVFEAVLAGLSDEISSPKLQKLLEAIIGLQPSLSDAQMVPPWLAILSRGYEIAAQLEPADVFVKLPELMQIVSRFLTSSSYNIRVSASECLISFCANLIPKAVVLDPSIHDDTVLAAVANFANSLLSVTFQAARTEVFGVLRALFDALRWRGDPALLQIAQAIGELRGNDAFQGKKEADEVLGSAIRNAGPQAILSILPPNLINPAAGQSGRVWLLPLLRDHVSNTNLAHFKSELIPLSEAMYERVLAVGKEKTMESKIFETIIQQVWAAFPGYCDLPRDLINAFDQPFAELLSNLLYKEASLRVDLCRGLQNLVESNQAILLSDLSDEDLDFEHRTTKAKADANIRHLQQYASNLLAILFNVYSETQPHSRAYILQCINAYLSITPEKDLVETFERVSQLFESSLPAGGDGYNKQKEQPKSEDKKPPMSHTLLDLIVTLSTHLPRSSFVRLFSLASNLLNSVELAKSEPQLLKKAYKIIPRLATSETGSDALRERSVELQALILATGDKTPVPARRDRMLAIHTIVDFLPLTELHFIPSVLSEIVVACKESNKNARAAAFDLLIGCAEEIAGPHPEGTIIRNHLVSHMPNDAPDAPASLEEVFTMVSAGLAGVAPHMIAASITALARLLFEFDDRLDTNFKKDIGDTVAMFVQSNNREIVRAVLGFLKVFVVVPSSNEEGESQAETIMKTVTPALMVWSKENKGRLRVKVRDLLDRCIRRFGAEAVESWADGEERKMIVNIRKRRDKAKRKKKGGVEADEASDEEYGQQQKQFENEYDEAIYGSDDDDDASGSDEDASDDEAMSGVSFRKDTRASKARHRGEAPPTRFIRQSSADDEPLDLLDATAAQANISSRKSVRFNSSATTPTTKRKSRVNEDRKLVFTDANGSNSTPRRKTPSILRPDDDGDTAMQEHDDNTRGNDNDADAVDAYVEAVSGPHAIQRGQRGRLKIKSAKQENSNTGISVRDSNGTGDISADEARQVGRALGRNNSNINRNNRPQSGNGGARGIKPKDARRGLGVEKRRGGGGEVGANRGANGRKVFKAGGGAGPGNRARGKGRPHGGWKHGAGGSSGGGGRGRR